MRGMHTRHCRAIGNLPSTQRNMPLGAHRPAPLGSKVMVTVCRPPSAASGVWACRRSMCFPRPEIGGCGHIRAACEECGNHWQPAGLQFELSWLTHLDAELGLERCAEDLLELDVFNTSILQKSAARNGDRNEC